MKKINWKKVTVGQFDDIAEIRSEIPFRLKMQQIAILENKEIEEILKWKIEDVYDYDIPSMPKTKLRFWFVHNKKFYRLPKNAKKIKASQFIDLQTSDGTIAMNLAILAQRVNLFGKVVDEDIEDRIKEFREIPILKIKPYADFFLHLYPLLLEATRDYLKQAMTELKATQPLSE
jgi:hypothetical protein